MKVFTIHNIGSVKKLKRHLSTEFHYKKGNIYTALQFIKIHKKTHQITKPLPPSSKIWNQNATRS